jgi:hypothetical protein
MVWREKRIKKRNGQPDAGRNDRIDRNAPRI